MPSYTYGRLIGVVGLRLNRSWTSSPEANCLRSRQDITGSLGARKPTASMYGSMNCRNGARNGVCWAMPRPGNRVTRPSGSEPASVAMASWRPPSM
ncbi:hypothetical protein SCANM63S_03423 [Streptomyces canarius]